MFSEQCNREKLAKHYKTGIIDHVKLVYEMLQQQRTTLTNQQTLLEDHVSNKKHQFILSFYSYT